jgi:hypothetical protein
MTITAQQLAAALRAAANALLQGSTDATGTLVSQLAPDVTAPALVPTTPPALAQSSVTADQLTNLIMPHISNQAVKDALGVAMRENGVANLPEAQPHQYGTLYTAFQGVLARFGIGGAAPAATATTAPII